MALISSETEEGHAHNKKMRAWLRLEAPEMRVPPILAGSAGPEVKLDSRSSSEAVCPDVSSFAAATAAAMFSKKQEWVARSSNGLARPSMLDRRVEDERGDRGGGFGEEDVVGCDANGSSED
jgi:hypothetical protein